MEGNEHLILAFVGMPGAGKTEASAYLRTKGLPIIRFGDLTDEGLSEMHLPVNPQNEAMFREKIRQELGMAAYAIKAKPKIDALLQANPLIILDGVYSWEEYVYLLKTYQNLKIIHIFAQPAVRYNRLSVRKVRPFSPTDARKRDIAEIENLHKAGPIAIADYLIENTGDLSSLHTKIDELLQVLQK